MGTDSFIIHVKTEDIFEDIANDVVKGIDSSNYEINRLLSKGKNKKVIGLMKDELGGKIMTEFIGLGLKTYSYLVDGGSNNKKVKGTKKCVIKQMLKFKDYKNCLLNNNIILKSQQRFKSEAYNVFTNKIALSSNDDNQLQTFDKIISYPCGVNAGKVCNTELLEYLNRTQSKIKIYSKSSIQNINNRRFWTRKNKCIIKSNKQSTRC